MLRRLLQLAGVLAVAAPFAAALAVHELGRQLEAPYRGYAAAEVFVAIDSGDTTRTISRRLANAGVVRDEVTFRAAAWWDGRGRTLQAGDNARAADEMNRAIEVAMLLALPAAAALIAMPHAVAGVLFERGAFTAADTEATAAAIAAFAAGLPAFVLVRVLQPGFFARGDMRTPFRITVVVVVLNTGLSLALYRAVGHVGIAAATSAAAWANTALLWAALRRRDHCRADKRLLSRLPRAAGAALIMAAALVAGLEAADAWLAGGEARRIAALAALCGGGLAVFALAALALGAVRTGEVRRLLARSRARPRD